MPGKTTACPLNCVNSRPCSVNGSLAISLLRLDGQTNIAAANRHHARHPQRTLNLLQTS
jgi:hypothetical protein